MRQFGKMSITRKICLFAAFAALLCGCVVSDDPESVLYMTEPVEVTPANGVWDSEYGRTSDTNDCSFVFTVSRHPGGIGVHAIVRDNKLTTDGCEPGDVAAAAAWDDDNIECFFDGDNDRSKDARSGNGFYFGGEFILTANGAAQSGNSGRPGSFGSLWRGTARPVRSPDGGWLIQYDLFFSWACIGRQSPPAGDEDVAFGFNICVHDDDDGGRADRALYWKGTPVMPYRDESAFGTIVLKGRKKK